MVKYTGAHLWNDLPSDIQNSSSLSTFKDNVKKLFLGQYNSEWSQFQQN